MPCPFCDPTSKEPQRLSNGPISVDLGSRQAFVRGRRVKLPPSAFAILGILVRNAGAILNAEQIIEKLDPYGERDVSYSSIKVYIYQIRKALRAEGVQLKTSWGYGWYLEEPSDLALGQWGPSVRSHCQEVLDAGFAG